jgi:hypothetical protein
MPKIIGKSEQGARQNGERESLLDDVKSFIKAHANEAEFAVAKDVVKWGPKETLVNFENYAAVLPAEERAGTLEETRKLVRRIDRQTRPSDFVDPDETDIAAVLNSLKNEAVKPAFGAKDEDDLKNISETEAEYDEAVRQMSTGAPEPALRLIENAIYYLNKEISDQYKEPNEDPANEKAKRAQVKTIERERDALRRARLALLDKMFGL